PPCGGRPFAVPGLAPAGGAAGQTLAGVAVAAVHRSTFGRLERYLGRLAAAAAGHVHHLAATVGATGAHRTVARACTGCRAALRTAGRIILEPSVREELLFAHGEGKRLAAVAASQGFIGVAQQKKLALPLMK